MSITVIVPTIVERDPQPTINSFRSQLNSDDRQIIAFDTAHQGHYGHPVRNQILDQGVETDYVCTIDDDDIYHPWAFSAMRHSIETHPGRWFVFQMVGGANSTFPNRVIPTMGHTIHIGNIGTPMLLWPATAKARFGHRYSGDHDMALDLQWELGDPIWVDQVIAIIRPEVPSGLVPAA